jgi:predicted transcriptional regulator
MVNNNKYNSEEKLASLYGKSDIYKFRIEIRGNIKSFDFLQVKHQDNGGVLCQVTNIIRDRHLLLGDCKVIGYRDAGVLKNIRTPFEQNSQVLLATDTFIEKTIGLNTDDKNFIGVIEHHPNLKINLDLKKAITKHIAILAKSGAGKSYTVGVILEEVMKKNIPIVILDPHNEYSSLKYPNSNEKDVKRLDKFGLKPEGFLGRVEEFSPAPDLNPQAKPINLDINLLTPQTLVDSMPQKLSPAQQNIIFNVLANSATGRIDIDEIIFNVSAEESNAKWSLISQLEQLKQLKLYSDNPVPLTDIVKFKQCSIISLKGVDPFVSETFVAGLLNNLFEARKKDEIPPFLLVLEEAHNFCPERSLGEKKASKVIRTIAGEGRKFGLGLCLISQRPAKVDKNVVSQCTTQILLKMTNPNDLKSVIQSSEGVGNDSEEEIQKLNIGTCLLTGVIDIPLKLNIRPRISKHGGESVDVTMSYEADEKYETKVKHVPTSDSVPQRNQVTGDQMNAQRPHDANNQQNHATHTRNRVPVQENRLPENSMSMNPNAHGPGATANEIGKQRTAQMQDQYRQSRPAPTSQARPKPATNDGKYYQFIAPEVSVLDAQKMQKNPALKTHMIPATLAKVKTKSGKEVSILFDRVSKIIVKDIYPIKGLPANINVEELSDTEKKLIKTIIELPEVFNPAELLMKTNVMFNEILRICDNLAKKGLLEKRDKQFKSTGLKFVSEIDNLNFFGEQKFEEIMFNQMHNQEISEKAVKDILSMAGDVLSVKDLYIVKYV